MKPVWRRAVGPGSQADGGVNSTAYDGTRIYGSDAIDSQIFALDRSNGHVAALDGRTAPAEIILPNAQRFAGGDLDL